MVTPYGGVSGLAPRHPPGAIRKRKFTEEKMIAGIDPGISGGIALVDQEGRFVSGLRMPVLRYRGKALVDARALYDYLRDHSPGAIVIEHVHAMPRQGVSSSFTFGRMAGGVEAIAQLIAPIEWVTPNAWKKALGLSSVKQESFDAALLRFGPNKLWAVKANEGIVEASLMAAYYLDKLGPLK
jgi:crossover junction endodeoxyribonuclease RuvC